VKSMTADLPQTLHEWLARCDQLHPVEIEMTLERVQLVAQRLDMKFTVPVIVVAGTNGKGSTCAMIESIALQAGYRVGLYIKPHLVEFQERCQLQGQPVDPQALVPHFAAVEQARGATSLTYFEFTTLVILRLLSQEPLDLIILEVGMGGRLDAVNIVDADCAVITNIDLDHVEFLGTDRESIGREKAGIMRAYRPVVVSDPSVPLSVIEHAQSIGADLRLINRDFGYQGDRHQWSWQGKEQRFSSLAYPALRGANQLLNASGALAALETLRDQLPVSSQAVRQGFASVQLPGRFQIVPGQPILVLDVAHNPHSVAVLVQNLDQMGFFPHTHAVFGAMKDKDLRRMMTSLAPIIDSWHFTNLPATRAASAEELQNVWLDSESLVTAETAKRFKNIASFCHSDPSTALKSALHNSQAADRIVVFGSFLTVGGVMKVGLPKLDAPHFDSESLKNV
jgi:dihydrofolate synthase / folylpolyglutamate synthase